MSTMGYTPLATSLAPTSDCSPRSVPVDMIVLHHGATTNLQAIVDMMQPGGRKVSAHAAVKDKQIVGTVDENMRAWSLSDAYWDSRAFTVETANESTAGWTVSAESHESLAQLSANWATRFGFKIIRDNSVDRRLWTLIGHREVYEIHGGSYPTACPGGMDLDWIANRAIEIMNPPEEEETIMASELLQGPDAQSNGATILAVCSPGLVMRYSLSYKAQLEAQHGPAVTLNQATMDARQKAYQSQNISYIIDAINALAGSGGGLPIPNPGGTFTLTGEVDVKGVPGKAALTGTASPATTVKR